MAPGNAQEVSREFFEGLWFQHPEGSVKTVGWGSRESQKERFRILTGLDDMKGKSVLDVGCGFGGFYGYLTLNSVDQEPARYLGIDRNARTLHEAAVRYQSTDFLEEDFLEAQLDNFDYVVASGIFSLEADDWWDNMERTMRKMFDLCTIGMATNFLSQYHESWVTGSRYAAPDIILNFAMSITKKVHLIHGYLSNDFTVYLYR